MRDDHRPKQELIHEITGLRKQVVDLKEAMTARRRVEDALRRAEISLRALSDGAPVGLVLFREDGTLISANRPFATMLGYDSPAELQALSAVCSVFASPEEQCQALRPSSGSDGARLTQFRSKDGCRRSHAVLAGQQSADRAVTLAVFDIPTPLPQTFPAPSA
ncbi:MAG TPA: PAS domain-containing protein [Gemmatimonadales bacterium]|nr:PAS domain-containing protein [Gemmatimonadales bacterium]